MAKTKKKLFGDSEILSALRKLQADVRSLTKTANKTERMVTHMAGTFEEATAAFGELKVSITEQKEQTAKLIAAVDKLVSAVGSNPDFAPLIAEINAAKADLRGDDQAVQDALDKANPPTPSV